MTNPRQMLMSVGAMLFTLAFGVAVGAGPLQGDADQQLRAEVDELEQDNAELSDQVAAGHAAGEHAETFASTALPELVATKLADQHVVLVSLPGAKSEQRDELQQTLEAAEATVTGSVDIDARWAEPGQQQFLEDLTARLVTADTALPDEGNAYDRAGALLARALVATEADDVGIADNEATAILGGLGAGELLEADEEVVRADAAVVLAPPTPRVDGDEDADAIDAQNAAWGSMAQALDSVGGGVVVAGEPEAARGEGLLGALRLDGVVREEVSTVDELDTARGRIGVVYALAEQLDGGVGHYGMVDPVDGPMVDPPADEGSSEGAADEGDDVGPDAMESQPDAGR